jgi:hypothetical protein
MGKAAGGALKQSQTGLFSENRDYGAARGVTGQTGASGRDFAKQAEGLGGLVRLYATFAANIFAVSMAFEALKRSFQFEQLKAASDAFAVTTGKNLSYVAQQMKELSQGSLTDKAAQSYANYGASAGFTADQMKRLVVVAKGASQALGRDMGDSIDRLIRGTGKLEPELLDELGLLTRTKQAGVEYGKAIGKTFEQLTQFEKTQAFVNAVLKEGEQKFGAVANAVDVSPFEKLQAAVINVGTSILNFMNKGIAPLASFLASNSTALYAGIIAAILYLAKTALPMLTASAENDRKSMAKSLEVSQDYYTKRAEFAKKSADYQIEQISRIKTTLAEYAKAEGKEAETALAALKKKPGSVGTAARAYTGDPTKFANAMTTGGKTVVQHTEDEMKMLQKKMDLLNRADKQQSEQWDNLNTKYQRHFQNQVHLITLTENQETAENRRALTTQQNMRLVELEGAAKRNQLEIERTYSQSRLATAKLEGSSRISEAAQLGGLKAALTAYKEEYKAVTVAKTEANAIATRYTATMNNLSVAVWSVKAGISGAVGVITGLAGAINTAFFVVGTLVAAFQLLIAVTGGVNKSYDALITAQETFDNVLKNSSSQVARFTELSSAINATAASLLLLKEYSSNVFSGLTDGITSTAKAFRAFSEDSGWWTSIKEKFSSLFNNDTTTTQVTQLKKSIYTALATVAPEDKAKVEKAILSAIPNTSSVTEAVQKLSMATGSALAQYGESLSNEFAKVDIGLKSNVGNMKMAAEAGRSLATEIDKLDKKDDVKNSKYSAVVAALKTINEQYKNASTLAEKQTVLASMTQEQFEKLVKLGKDHNVDMSKTVELYREAKFAIAERAELSKRIVEEERAAAYTRAQDLVGDAGLKDFLDKKRNLERAINELKTSGNVGTASIAARKAKEEFDDASKRLMGNKNLEFDPAAKAAMIANISTIGKNVGEEYANSVIIAIQNRNKDIASAATAGLEAAGRKLELPTPEQPQSETVRKHIKIVEEQEQWATSPLQKGKPKEGFADSLIDKLATEKNKESAKLSKYWDIELKNAQSYLALLKERSNLQKELIGYVGEELSTSMMLAEINVAQKNYEKENAQLALESAKRSGDISRIKATEAQLAQKAEDATLAELQNKTDLLTINNLNLAADREKSRLEQNYYSFLEKSLAVQAETNKFKKEFFLISEQGSAIESANIKAAQELLALDKERNSIAILVNKNKEIVGNEDISADRRAAAAIDLKYAEQQLAINEKLRGYKEQFIKLERDLTIEKAKQDQYWKQITATAEAYNSIIEFQLSTQSSIVSYGQVSYANAQQEAILIMQSTKALREKLTLLGLSMESEEGQVIALSEQLKITQQIYDNRRKIWELAAKDDSGADFGKTLAQGFQYAVEDFRKNMSSAITSIIGATMSGIDASVDYIIKNLKDGVQSTLKGMAKAFGQTAKDVLLQYLGDKVKLAMKQIIANMFEDKAESLEQINQKVADSMRLANDTLKTVDATNNKLISALESLEQTIKNSASNVGKTELVQGFASAGQADQDLAEMSVSAKTVTADLDQSADSFDTLGSSVESTSAAMNIAGGSMLQTAGGFSKGMNNVLGSIKSLLGTFGIKLGGTAGSVVDALSGVGSMLSSVASIGTNASGALGMLSSASSWAATGATSFATSLTGEMLGLSTAVEINAGAVTMLTTGIGDAMIGLAAAAPYIAAVVAVAYAAYKIFGQKKGGPKLEGYGGAGVNESGVIESSDVIQSGDRGHKSTNAGKEMAEDWSKGVLIGVKSFMDSAGRKMATGVGVGLGFEVDVAKDATGNSKGIGTVKKGGQVVYSSNEGGAPHGDEEGFQKWLAEESKRTMLAALKAQDDLPKNVAAYFETIAYDAIKDLSPEEVTKKLDFASVLVYIDTNETKLTKLFGESIYNITEEGLQAFQVTGESYAQTLARLADTFEITNKVAKIVGVSVEKAFDKVGLAGYEMRNKLIKAAGGLEAFTQKFTFFYENFFSEGERGALAFSEAQQTLADGFAQLGYEMPTTREGFRDLMTEFVGMGEAGQGLVAQLLDLAPAFDVVHDAIEGALGVIENALSSIQQKASDFRTQILDDTQSDEERWNRIKGQVDANVNVLDTIGKMSDKDLGALSVADIVKKTTDVQKNTEDAIGGVQKLWDSLSEDEKKIRGPEFLKWIDTIETNSATILARLGQAAIKQGGKTDANGVATTAGPTATAEDSATLLAGLPESLATKLDASFITGADLLKTKMQEVFDGFAATFTGVMYNTGGAAPAGYSGTLPSPGGEDPDPSIEQTLTLIDTIREKAKSDQQATFDQQQAAIETLTAKLLDAAQAIADAAAGHTLAAADMKQAAAAIPSKFEITVEQADPSGNSVGVK